MIKAAFPPERSVESLPVHAWITSYKSCLGQITLAVIDKGEIVFETKSLAVYRGTGSREMLQLLE